MLSDKCEFVCVSFEIRNLNGLVASYVDTIIAVFSMWRIAPEKEPERQPLS